MAEIKELTLNDFIGWCKTQVDAEELSALMTSFGYTDYGIDTIVAAIEEDKHFEKAFGKLVRASLAEEKGYFEMNRASGEVTGSDWLAIALGTVGSIGTSISNILTGKSVAQNTAAEAAQAAAEAEKAKSGSTIFLWIILAVVVIAVGIILWLSSKKK